MKDVTIILQGLVAPKQLELWKKNYKNWNVIISCWTDEEFDFYQGIVTTWLPKKWKVIKNQYPIIRFKPEANLDYQITSTLNALREVNTKYVIKSRLDEFYSNIDKLVVKLKRNEEKIVCGSVFFRKYGMYPFHIADKLMCGTKDNLTLMFESTLHNIEMKFWDFNIPESQLGVGYVMGKEIGLDFENWKRALNNYNNYSKSESEILKDIRVATNILIKNSSDILSDMLFYDKPDWGGMLEKIEHSNYSLQICRKELSKLNYEELDSGKYVRKYFDVVDVNQLQPYIVTRSNGGPNGGRKWWYNDFNNEEEDCVTNLQHYGRNKKSKK